MGILAYIIVGLLAGILAKFLMPGSRSEPTGLVGTIVLGIVGAVIGGWVWNLALGRPGATGVDIDSILVAVVGSCLVLVILRMTRRSA